MQSFTYEIRLLLALEDLYDCKVLWQFLGRIEFAFHSIHEPMVIKLCEMYLPIFWTFECVLGSFITFPSELHLL